jgi:predicted SnoaL-like aldol condensation-catalyzing enzyme
MADNMQIVLNAFETLFNKRDYAAAERFWSPNYIQHSAHIPPGREGLFALIKGAPEALHYENGLTVANGDYVLLHGRFSGLGRPANWIVVDIVRLENGQLAVRRQVPGVILPQGEGRLWVRKRSVWCRTLPRYRDCSGS